ncbi:hypothetical protein AVEN_135551-1 [Araneus ventricosus]|uniref:Uncharacterized protein n=1 Tax=Araneus ventricosus TaxID=182803 RepID=A0A4Y2WVW6_ARAVE|nr:hypothetical protein AVEN_269404-1 [Araneus ventricosus]GBO40600.1 hypothetical protein AVEN_135551-1 [Araneus ventricosus]
MDSTPISQMYSGNTYPLHMVSKGLAKVIHFFHLLRRQVLDFFWNHIIGEVSESHVQSVEVLDARIFVDAEKVRYVAVLGNSGSQIGDMRGDKDKVLGIAYSDDGEASNMCMRS